MLTRFLAVILGLFFIIAPVMAQDTTPTAQPEQAFIIGWSSEVIFPAAIRFTVSLGRPLTQLTAASLLIQPEGGTPVTVDINLHDAAVVQEPYTQLAYVWSLPSDNLPDLFGNVTYKWRVISVEGQAALIEEHVLFSDQRTQWLRDQAIGQGVKLTLADTGDSGFLTTLQSSLKPVYDLLSTQLAQKPALKVLLDTLSDCVQNAANISVAVGPVSRTEAPCTAQMADAIFRVSNTDIVRSTGDTEDVQNLLAAYLTSRFYAAAWDGKNVPAWFQAGLGLFYSPTLKTALGPPLVTAARTNALLSSNAMNVKSTTSATADLWTAQSYGMVVYIASQIGVKGLFKLAADVGTADSFDTAYQADMGRTLAALLPDFGRWIFTSEGQAAFLFTPYQAATATPTATTTATATFTDTPTATSTFTPTATPTGFLTFTPRPTESPTLTTTPAPATRTPRPPGSLNTATATPIPPSPIAQAADNPRIGLFILAIGILIIAISAVIYRMLRGK